MAAERQIKMMPPDCCRGLRALVKGFVRLAGRLLFRYRFEGLENVPAEGAFILVANHTSMIDVAAIHISIDRWVHWVAKKELFTTPVVRYFMPRMGAIPVDREKVDLTAARGIFAVLQAERIVAMFPQGTRVKPENINKVLPKTGAAHFAIKTKAQLLPVAIEGRVRLFGRIRYVFGKPFNLDIKSGKYSQDELMDISIDIMRHIYSLIDVQYDPEKNVTKDTVR